MQYNMGTFLFILKASSEAPVAALAEPFNLLKKRIIRTKFIMFVIKYKVILLYYFLKIK